jgi:replicative DNA helicase
MRRIKSLGDQVAELRKFSMNPQQRIRTGIPTLDTLTRGPAPGEVYTILGRSYSGKSLFGQNVMLANQDKGGIFFSLEMYHLQAVERLFSMWSGFDAAEVALMTQENRLPPLLDEMSSELDRMVIVDDTSLSTTRMAEYLAQYTEMYGTPPDFVVIDYLELVAGAKTSGEGWMGTESQAQQIKDFAKEQSVPVFLLHQTNKSEAEWLPPTMGSARGGGYTEADFVVGMWRPYLDPELSWFEAEAARTQVMFTILKNRPFGAHNQRPIECRLSANLKIEEVR